MGGLGSLHPILGKGHGSFLFGKLGCRRLLRAHLSTGVSRYWDKRELIWLPVHCALNRHSAGLITLGLVDLVAHRHVAVDAVDYVLEDRLNVITPAELHQGAALVAV